jgi:hypothetical protein
VTSEPLQPIADAIPHEAVRLDVAYGLPLDAVVTMAAVAAMIVVRPSAG